MACPAGLAGSVLVRWFGREVVNVSGPARNCSAVTAGFGMIWEAAMLPGLRVCVARRDRVAWACVKVVRVSPKMDG